MALQNFSKNPFNALKLKYLVLNSYSRKIKSQSTIFCVQNTAQDGVNKPKLPDLLTRIYNLDNSNSSRHAILICELSWNLESRILQAIITNIKDTTF